MICVVVNIFLPDTWGMTVVRMPQVMVQGGFNSYEKFIMHTIVPKKKSPEKCKQTLDFIFPRTAVETIQPAYLLAPV